jgi:hypothetical protein
MIKDEHGNRRFFGIYRGVVTDTKDPLQKGRIRATVPQVLGSEHTGWAWQVKPLGGTVTAHKPTETLKVIPASVTAGAGVFLMFEGGDPAHPVWLGTF